MKKLNSLNYQKTLIIKKNMKKLWLIIKLKSMKMIFKN